MVSSRELIDLTVTALDSWEDVDFPRSQPSGLTARESEALLLLAQGHTAAAAARRMGCSTSMVNRHLGKLYRKLGVNDRLGAVLEAQRRGLLPTHDPHSRAIPGALALAPRPASIADAAS